MILAAALWFTTSAFCASSFDCNVTTDTLCAVAYCRLYRLRCDGSDGPAPILIRQKTTISATEESLMVDDSYCASYWVTNVSPSGKESCFSNGVAVSSPLGVNDGIQTDAGPPEYYDLLGRKLSAPPDRPGVYWLRKGKAKGKKLIVLWMR